VLAFLFSDSISAPPSSSDRVCREGTNKTEGEVVCQMAAFVVSTEEEKGVGIPNLECPEIQNTLLLARVNGLLTETNVIETGTRTSIEK
jgi:hypothetical protein